MSSSVYEGICSLSAAASYPKALTFYRSADCHEPTPMDRCAVGEATWPEDAPPRFEVSTERVSIRAEDDTSGCEALPVLTASGTCDLPIEGVGDYDVIVDDDSTLRLTIPYSSSFGASCWSFGGRCETGAGPEVDLPDAISAGQPRTFELAELHDLDTPLPDACVVDVEDGGVGGALERPRIHVRLTFEEEAPGSDCIGIGRRATCLLPPLVAGDYEVVARDGTARSLTVR